MNCCMCGTAVSSVNADTVHAARGICHDRPFPEVPGAALASSVLCMSVLTPMHMHTSQFTYSILPAEMQRKPHRVATSSNYPSGLHLQCIQTSNLCKKYRTRKHVSSMLVARQVGRNQGMLRLRRTMRMSPQRRMPSQTALLAHTGKP